MGRTRFHKISTVLAATCAALACSFILTSQTNPTPGEWRTYGGDKGFNRYSPLDQINRENVKNLSVVWGRPAVDPEIKDKFPDLSPSNYFRGTPIVIDGVLYAPNGVGLVARWKCA